MHEIPSPRISKLFLKRILILAYYFPPLGGVGAHRPVKLAKYLRDFGYEPIIVTGPATGSVDWAPADPALSRDVPADLRVLRPDDELDSPAAVHRLRRWLGLRAPFDRSWEHAATQLARKVMGEFDLVFATMSPFGTAAAATAIAAESGKPWVADLQDPWALDEWTVYPTAAHRSLDKRRMVHDLSGASAVIMNTEEAVRAVRAELPGLDSRRVVAITQGWDSDDFTKPVTVSDGSRFRIVYAGFSHVQRGDRHRSRRFLRTLAGGAAEGMDILARSHVFLLDALERVQRLDPELAGGMELHVAGAAPLDLSATTVPVRLHGYLPHDDAIALMRSADLLFLPMHDLPTGVRARTVPGKTYEYVASGRPILAALPDGDARDLVAALPNVWLCRPTDVDGMVAALRDILHGGGRPLAVPPVAGSFEWSRITGRIAGVLDDVLGTPTPQ